jgi:hypothetical protein
VGEPHAAFIKEKNFCLEEYIDYLHENKLSLIWDTSRDYYLISYGEAHSDNPTLELVDVSADRAGEEAQFIYTARRTLREERVSEHAQN